MPISQHSRCHTDRLEYLLNKVRRDIVQIYREMHSDLIESSDVCLATCIGSRAWNMSTADFPLVFLDEAGQCDEPSSLVPLMQGARHAVLIGDHKQLPSVVSNDTARDEGLNVSLFERLMLQKSESRSSCLAAGTSWHQADAF